MKSYIVKHCPQCGDDTVHIPTTLTFVLDHVLKMLTAWRWPSERTPSRYACSACDIRPASDWRTPQRFG